MANLSNTEQLGKARVFSIVERQTTRLSSPAFLNLAVVSLVASIGVAIFGRRKEFATFVGLWAPTFLLIGIYNKLVKSEELEKGSELKRAA